MARTKVLYRPKCNKCGRPFPSVSKFNRTCNACSQSNAREVQYRCYNVGMAVLGGGRVIRKTLGAY